MDVVEEYLLMPRKKPLVVFYGGVRSRNLPRFVCKKNGETAHNQRCRFNERVCKLLHPQCTASPCKEVFQHRADRL